MANRLLSECLSHARREMTSKQQDSATSYFHWSFIHQRGKLLTWHTNALGAPPTRFGYRLERHSLHSETQAVKLAFGLLDKRRPWGVINIRLGRDGRLRESCPCPICRGFLDAIGCSRIEYTVTDGWARLVY